MDNTQIKHQIDKVIKEAGIDSVNINESIFNNKQIIQFLKNSGIKRHIKQYQTYGQKSSYNYYYLTKDLKNILSNNE